MIDLSFFYKNRSRGLVLQIVKITFFSYWESEFLTSCTFLVRKESSNTIIGYLVVEYIDSKYWLESTMEDSRYKEVVIDGRTESTRDICSWILCIINVFFSFVKKGEGKPANSLKSFWSIISRKKRLDSGHESYKIDIFDCVVADNIIIKFQLCCKSHVEWDICRAG